MDKQALKRKAYEEFKEFLIIAVYLWIVFGLFILYKSFILNQQKFAYLAHGLALINALALGKVILIAQALHLGERSSNEPLLYPTLRKAALFAFMLAAVKILEAFLVGRYRGYSFAESITEFGGGTWQGMTTLTLLMFFTLIPFFAFTELKRVLGKGKLYRLFFKPSDPERFSEGERSIA